MFISLVAQIVKSLLARRPGFNLWVGKIPWRKEWQPTPVFSPEEFHGQGSLAGYSPWGRIESDTTERVILGMLKNDAVVAAVNFRTFSSPQEDTVPLALPTPFISSSPNPWQLVTDFVSIDSPLLDISYK